MRCGCSLFGKFCTFSRNWCMKQRMHFSIYLHIYGLQKGKCPIADRGNGTLTIQGGTLLCDGRPVASKQMVLTK